MQPHDGRYIDASIGVLEGEGSHQKANPDAPPHAAVWPLVPSQFEAGAASPTYYDRPAIKPPVWIWTIPVYFYIGGIAGAAMTMGMAAQLTGGPKMRLFDERCRWVGAIGGGIGSALLIADLGRKTRFLNMLRVFRPTSPMSVGSWVLATATPLSAGSALLTMARGRLRFLGDLGGIGAGVLGMPLATYTAVLIANTAVPLWQETRRSLPLLFGASSMASMAAVFDMLPLEPREHIIVRRFGFIGRAAELMAAEMVNREAAVEWHVARPLHEGLSGALWNAARALTASSLVVSVMPGRWRGKRTLAGVLGALGGLCVRLGIFYAGKKSAKDPRATFRQQRAGHGAAEVTGSPAVTGPVTMLPHPRTVEEVRLQRIPD